MGAAVPPRLPGAAAAGGAGAARLSAVGRLHHRGRRGGVRGPAQPCLRLARGRRDRPVRHRPTAHPGHRPRPPSPGGAPGPGGGTRRGPHLRGRTADPARPLPGQRPRLHRYDPRARHRRPYDPHPARSARRTGPVGAAAHPRTPPHGRTGRPGRGRRAAGAAAGGGGGAVRVVAGTPRRPAPPRLHPGLPHPGRRRRRAGPARLPARPPPRQPRPPRTPLRRRPLPPALLQRCPPAPPRGAVDRRLEHGLVGGVHHQRQPQPPDGVRRGRSPARGHRRAREPRARAARGLAGERAGDLRGAGRGRSVAHRRGERAHVPLQPRVPPPPLDRRCRLAAEAAGGPRRHTRRARPAHRRRARRSGPVLRGLPHPDRRRRTCGRRPLLLAGEPPGERQLGRDQRGDGSLRRPPRAADRRRVPPRLGRGRPLARPGRSASAAPGERGRSAGGVGMAGAGGDVRPPAPQPSVRRLAARRDHPVRHPGPRGGGAPRAGTPGRGERLGARPSAPRPGRGAPARRRPGGARARPGPQGRLLPRLPDDLALPPPRRLQRGRRPRAPRRGHRGPGPVDPRPAGPAARTAGRVPPGAPSGAYAPGSGRRST